jgi:hypothetical protein
MSCCCGHLPVLSLGLTGVGGFGHDRGHIPAWSGAWDVRVTQGRHPLYSQLSVSPCAPPSLQQQDLKLLAACVCLLGGGLFTGGRQRLQQCSVPLVPASCAKPLCVEQQRDTCGVAAHACPCMRGGGCGAWGCRPLGCASTRYAFHRVPRSLLRAAHSCPKHTVQLF